MNAVTKMYTCMCGSETMVTRSTDEAHENQVVVCPGCGVVL